MEDVAAELCFTHSLSGHPNVVEYVDGWLSPTQGVLVTKLGDDSWAGILQRTRLSRLEEHDSLKLIRDMFSGLAHLHSHEVAHRDMKPANMTVCAGSIQIVDLGSACRVDDPAITETVITTFPYRAPEVILKCKNPRGKYVGCGKAGDMWACGCIIAEAWRARAGQGRLFPLLDGQEPELIRSIVNLIGPRHNIAGYEKHAQPERVADPSYVLRGTLTEEVLKAPQCGGLL